MNDLLQMSMKIELLNLRFGFFKIGFNWFDIYLMINMIKIVSRKTNYSHALHQKQPKKRTKSKYSSPTQKQLRLKVGKITNHNVTI